MRETLEALAAGELTPSEAETRLRGYATLDAGETTARFDASRDRRRGIPEGILADGKRPAEVAAIAETALETTGRALVTRADEPTADRVTSHLAETRPAATVDHDPRGRTILAESPDFTPPETDGEVAVVTGGGADAGPAREAATVARAAGPEVELIEDVGVANLDRLLDVVPDLDADCVVAVAGREAALPTVLAGRVAAPVIALPVASGYGVGGDGLAALLSVLQSCTVCSVVNVDAGFVAGSQAALVARATD
ncbi:MAG: nickel pincer cofactor biosynthesis protein LarB [Halobaculum sp.]